MDEVEVPGEVQTLLRECIDSHEEIGILLLLAQEPAANFTAQSVSERLKISVSLAESALERLRDNGLVRRSLGEMGAAYRYAPLDANRSRSVELFMREYRDNWLGIVQLISANAIDRMRTETLRVFAAAFVLGREKDKKDG